MAETAAPLVDRVLPKARDRGGIRQAQYGAVTFAQRFGDGRQSQFERESGIVRKFHGQGVHGCKMPVTDVRGSAHTSLEGYIRPKTRNLGKIIGGLQTKTQLILPIRIQKSAFTANDS